MQLLGGAKTYVRPPTFHIGGGGAPPRHPTLSTPLLHTINGNYPHGSDKNMTGLTVKQEPTAKTFINVRESVLDLKAKYV